MNLPPVTPPYVFYIYQGRAPGVFTNKVFMGAVLFDKSGTNFTGTITNLPAGMNWLAATAMDTRSKLESDFSAQLAWGTNEAINVTLVWMYPRAPYNPPAKVVTVSAGTNSLSLTNPNALAQFYCLRGLSWTQAELLATDRVRLPSGGPAWMRLAVWSYASNRVPQLTITIK